MMAKEMNKTDKMRKLFADKALDAEQMDNVAGGKAYEISDDSCFLNILLMGRPGQPDRYGDFKCSCAYTKDDINKEVTNAWATVGVNAVLSSNTGNQYFINGKAVTQEQAYSHAMNVVGRHLKESDWYWGDGYGKG